jgi:uncharacterized membrane protein
MKSLFKNITLDKLFFWGILIKSFIGFWEFLGGAFLAVSGQRIVNSLGIFLTNKTTDADPDDFVWDYLLKITNNITHSAEVFTAIYLMFHGALNILLSVALAKKKIGWYPFILFLLFLFFVYEIYRVFLHHSLFVLALSIFDAIFIGVVFLEYRRQKKHAHA